MIISIILNFSDIFIFLCTHLSIDAINYVSMPTYMYKISDMYVKYVMCVLSISLTGESMGK